MQSKLYQTLQPEGKVQHVMYCINGAVPTVHGSSQILSNMVFGVHGNNCTVLQAGCTYTVHYTWQHMEVYSTTAGCTLHGSCKEVQVGDVWLAIWLHSLV